MANQNLTEQEIFDKVKGMIENCPNTQLLKDMLLQTIDNYPKTAHDLFNDFMCLKLLSTPVVGDLSVRTLSTRTLNCLRAADIDTLGDLISYDKRDLLKFRNFGKKSLKEIEKMVEEMGLKFGTKTIE